VAQCPAQAPPNHVATPAFAPYSHRMDSEDENPRLRRSLKIGLTTLGLDETVEILAQHRGERLRTGVIDAADRSWHFTLYLNATGTELLACSGVRREPPSKVGGQKLQL